MGMVLESTLTDPYIFIYLISSIHLNVLSSYYIVLCITTETYLGQSFFSFFFLSLYLSPLSKNDWILTRLYLLYYIVRKVEDTLTVIVKWLNNVTYTRWTS